MNKKVIYTVLLLIAISAFYNPANAITKTPQDSANISVDVDYEDVKSEAFLIKKVSIKDKLQRTPEAQIRNFYKNFNKYSEKNNIEKLKKLYSDKFVNNDGLDKETIFKLMQDSINTYKNVSYTTQIKDISISGFYATVKVVETGYGETVKSFKEIPGTGSVESVIEYTDYLIKENGKWVILSTNIEKENVMLRYGRAKIMEMNVSAPDCVPAGSEYDVGVTTNSSSEDFIVGSITNEEIKYPQEQAKDVLRAVKADELARVLKANTNGKNEYATVSLAVSQASVKENGVVINMDGIAILMHRINIVKKQDLK